MKNMELCYYTNDMIEEINNNPQKFFEMQSIIKKDFERIKIILENFEQSIELEFLIHNINCVIDSIELNRFEDDPEMELNIKVTDDYLIFSYYQFNREKNVIIFDTPSIVVMARNFKKIYFINEVYSIFKDEEENDYLNRGSDEITYFTLENKKVKQFEINLEEYTSDLFFNSFNRTNNFLDKIEKNAKLTLHKN